MIVDIILAVLSVSLLAVCIVLYRKNADLNQQATQASRDAERLRMELDNYKSTAEQIRQSEVESAQMRLNDLQNLSEARIDQLKL